MSEIQATNSICQHLIVQESVRMFYAQLVHAFFKNPGSETQVLRKWLETMMSQRVFFDAPKVSLRASDVWLWHLCIDDSVINTYMYIWLTDIQKQSSLFPLHWRCTVDFRNSRWLLGIDRISIYIVYLSSSAALWKKKNTAAELQNLVLCLTLF